MMSRIFAIAAWGACVGLIVLILCLIRHVPKRDVTYGTLFSMYVGAFLAFTLLYRSTYSERRFQLVPLVTLFFNLSKGRLYYVQTMLIDVVKTIPLGIFLGIKNADIKKTAKIGFLVSLSIEIFQFASETGVFDVDDIIFNTIGAVIGLLMLRIVKTAR